MSEEKKNLEGTERLGQLDSSLGTGALSEIHFHSPKVAEYLESPAVNWHGAPQMPPDGSAYFRKTPPGRYHPPQQQQRGPEQPL